MSLFDRLLSAQKLAMTYLSANTDEVTEKATNLVLQGNLLEEVGNVGEAITCYEAAVRLAPNITRPHLNLGNAFLSLGQLEAAINSYNNVLKIDKNNHSAIFNIGNAYIHSGKFELAEASFNRAICLKPDFVDAYVALGFAQEELGQLTNAIASYKMAVAEKPDYVEAQCNLGNALSALENHDEAIEVFRKALGINPKYFLALNGLTKSLQALGKNEEVLTTIRNVLEYAPDSAETHNNLGIALQASGKLTEALESHQTAVVITPELAAAHYSLGTCLQKLDRIEEAIKSYRRAIDLEPNFIEPYSDLGNMLMNIERPDEAAIIFELCACNNPNLAEAHCNLGTAYNKLGQLVSAELSFKKALAIKPAFAGAYNNLGACFSLQGKHVEAISAYRKAFELDPKLAQAHCNMGYSMRDLGRLTEAIECFDRALEINPQLGDAELNKAITYATFGDLEAAVSGVRHAMSLMPNSAPAHSTLLFLHNYLNDIPAPTLFEEAKRFGELVTRLAPAIAHTWPNSPTPERPLNIGLVSGDFRKHPVGFFVEGVLKALSTRAHDRIKLFGYSNSFQSDTITDRIKACCYGWHPITGISDEAVSNAIRQDKIDILIDLSGHTLHSRLPLFAWKPAPIQVTWLGYFATTGVPTIDYLVADPWTLPVSAEKYFTEKIIRLPETRLCFTPPDEKVEVAPLPALANGHITFGCFNTLTKINDDVVALWSEILHAVTNSKLLLMSNQFNEPAVIQQTIARFSARGINDKQLLFQKAVPRADYLACYNRVDIALDPFPYCGGTTTAEALWMGVPVLTLPGDQFLSRQGLGLLVNAGLPEWVAEDANDYVQRALKHASDLQYLASTRVELRSKLLASPVFDSHRFADHLESALRGIWQEWCFKQVQ